HAETVSVDKERCKGDGTLRQSPADEHPAHPLCPQIRGDLGVQDRQLDRGRQSFREAGALLSGDDVLLLLALGGPALQFLLAFPLVLCQDIHQAFVETYVLLSPSWSITSGDPSRAPLHLGYAAQPRK